MLIHTLDLHFSDRPHMIAAYLVEGSTGLILIEPGPASTIKTCLRSLKALGFSASDINHVFVTHIHLDHAGGAGWWAAQGAQVYVHPRGARHLIDPSRLLASAKMVYGDQMESLWGKMLPISAEKVTVLEDGDTVTIGDLTVEAIDTPGHAKHHHTYAIGDVAFTGDAVASRLPADQFINLTAAPPQFDPVAFDATITRLAARNFKKLYLTHFGMVDTVDEHLQRLREVVWGSAEFIHAQIRNGQPKTTIIKKYVEFCRERAELEGVDATRFTDYGIANGFEMSAEGIHLYWQRKLAGKV